ncbi:Transcriptional regulator-like protein [Nostocoides japonicum T1-X7]|uniref:Transcriptional regulator-like protein n=1 Tax=Nostocoides japonicum T1-X7 TaxID=1194083 RepID=A0A077LV07_9MICO|nr:YafY family protein [Tetrasphaera japonica]CCH76582.1 Transcriptional regulator-like protein [Tetrasphaera japonica T1-X7]
MSAPTGPAAKTERLLNLVLCLLYTRRPLPKSRLREMVPQYHRAPTTEAFDRMFERDKDELRDLGIPLVTEDLNSIWDDEPGYRIHQRDYALPDITFEPDELAVLGLASRTWAQASLAGPAAEAIRKLRAAGIERDEDSLVGIEPRLRTTEPAFEAVRRAVLGQQVITFDYRRSDGEVRTRRVHPWGMASWHGRWYLTGFDEARDAERLFRLSRVVGPVTPDPDAPPYAVPEDHDPAASVRRTTSDRPSPEPAVVRVRAGQGHALRRRARTAEDVDEFWTRLEVEYADVDSLVDELVGYGSDVVAQAPPELVRAVVTRLRGALATHGAPGAAR